MEYRLNGLKRDRLLVKAPHVTVFKMSRRLFVLSAGSAALTALSSSLLGVAGLKLLLRNSVSLYHVCQIEVEYPSTESGYEEFLLSRAKWMQVDEYQQILERFKAEGVLIKVDRNRFPGKVRQAYFFKTKAAHDRFVSLINAKSAVSDEGLAKVGYIFNRQYYVDTV